MQKTLPKWLYLSLAAILLLSCCLFFTGCLKKGNSNNTTPSIPDSPVFENIVKFIKANGSDYNNENYPGYTKNYTYSQDFPSDVLHQYDLLYSETSNTLILNGFNNFFSNFDIELQSAEGSNPNSYTVSGKIVLKDSVTNRQYSYIFTFTIPATEYKGMTTTISMPQFDSITKVLTIDDSQLPPVTDDEKKYVQDYIIKNPIYTHLLSTFNTFYVQQIQNGDTRYDGAIYKYFYLPVMIVS